MRSGRADHPPLATGDPIPTRVAAAFYYRCDTCDRPLLYERGHLVHAPRWWRP